MTRLNTTDLMRSLTPEDAGVFSILAGQGWNVFLEAHQLVWQNQELKEEHGPFASYEETVHAAHEIHKMSKAGNGRGSAPAPPHEVPDDLRGAGWEHETPGGKHRLLNRRLQLGTTQITFDEAVRVARKLHAREDKNVAGRKPFVEPEVTETGPPQDDTASNYTAVEVDEIVTALDATNTLRGFQAIISAHALDGLTRGDVDVRFVDEDRARLKAALERCAKGLGMTVEPPAGVAAAARAGGGTLFSDAPPHAPALTQQMHPTKILTHPRTLMRAGGLDEEYVRELQEKLRDGKGLPAVVVFYDGSDHWLADGNHRHEAARRENALLDVDVREGSLRDATLYAVGANAEHGLRRSNDDKRLQVVTLLCDEESFKKSDSQLARMAHVSQPFVGSVRQDVSKIVPLVGRDDVPDWQGRAEALGVPAGLIEVVDGLTQEDFERLSNNVISDTGARVTKTGAVMDTTGQRERRQQGAAQGPEAPPLFPEEEAEPAPYDGVVAALREAAGPLSRLELEEGGFPSALINAAAADGVIAQPERGVFALPAEGTPEGRGLEAAGEREPGAATPTAAETAHTLHTGDEQAAGRAERQDANAGLGARAVAPRAEPKREERPPVSSLLKGKTLIITFTYTPQLAGQVSVGVRLAEGDPFDTSYITLPESEVRHTSPKVHEAIAGQLKKRAKGAPPPAPAKKPAPRKPETKPGGRAAPEKPKKPPAKKAPAKRPAPKKPAKGAARARR